MSEPSREYVEPYKAALWFGVGLAVFNLFVNGWASALVSLALILPSGYAIDRLQRRWRARDSSEPD